MKGRAAGKKSRIMSPKRMLGFIALMVFIFIIVVLLARSSVLELRKQAEQDFVRRTLAGLKEVGKGGEDLPGPVYRVETGREEVFPGPVRELLGMLSAEPGAVRNNGKLWVYVPLEDGGYLITGTPYEEVIAWTKGFEAGEIRNVVLVTVAFGILTLVWMWADRRALAATQKAAMVDELERQVQQRTEAMNRMNRQARLGEFAASLAHEIRNPLGSLVTSAGLLPDAAPGEREELVKVLRRESGRLDRVLSDFLFFSRDIRPDIRRVSLPALLEQTMAGLKKTETFGETQVNFSFDPTLKPIPCDPEQMEQVFWNIALNGAEAMQGSGKLLISTRLIERRAEIRFEDSGPGVADDEMDRVFEPFYTGKRKGTGLGLSIAGRIMEAHHGYIQIETAGGGGSRFIVSLPLDQEEPC